MAGRVCGQGRRAHRDLPANSRVRWQRVALAGTVALLLRRWHVRKAPLALAKAAHLEWLAHPENPRSFRESYRSVARLVEWFDALPVDRRTDLCREVGLTIESDQFDESGLYRFSIAHHVPAFRLMRSHRRPGIGVPVVAWRPNDNSEKWDMLRPPEGIFVPATALLERRSDDHWTLRFLSPYTRESVSVGARSYPLAANFTAPIAKSRPNCRSVSSNWISRNVESLGDCAT